MGQIASNLACYSCSCHDLDLLSAARSGDMQQLQQTLAQQPLMLLLANLQGTGLLHVAAQHGQLEVIQLLLSMVKEHAPAIAAAVSAKGSQWQQQQQQRDDQELQQQQDTSGSSSSNLGLKQLLLLKRSHWSRSSRRQLKLLTKPRRVLHTLINWQTERGVSPLMLACRGGHAPCVSLLLAEGADPLLLDNITRRSCLHYAAVAGSTCCVHVLLHEWRQVLVVRRGREQQVLLQEVKMRDGVTGTNKYVDLRSSSGFSALHLATYWGHTDTVKALLAAGASTMLLTANRSYSCAELLIGRTSNALHIAAANGHVGAAVAILQAHVESTAQVVPRPLTWVQQTSHTAAAAAQPDQHQQQQPGQQPEQQLQQQQQQRLPWEGCPRSDPRAAVNSSGHTPADVAARTQQSDELLMLLDPGLPVTGVLQDSGLMAAPIKLPTLAVIAKTALDQHLISSLNRLQAQQQQQQQQQQLSTKVVAAADSDVLTKCTAAAAAFSAKSDMITVCWELTPSPSCSSMLSLGELQAAGATGLGNTVSACDISDDRSVRGARTNLIDAGCDISVPNDEFTTSDATELTNAVQSSSSSSSSSSSNSSDDRVYTNQPGSSACYDCCSSDGSDCICGICFESPCSVVIDRCKHNICLGCAEAVITVTTSCKPAVCPFCRQEVAGFTQQHFSG